MNHFPKFMGAHILTIRNGMKSYTTFKKQRMIQLFLNLQGEETSYNTTLLSGEGLRKIEYLALFCSSFLLPFIFTWMSNGASFSNVIFIKDFFSLLNVIL